MADETVTLPTPTEYLDKVGGWHALLPDEATIDYKGAPTKLRDVPDIRNAKDLPTLAKAYLDSQRELGARVRVPGPDAKPEDRQAFLDRITEAGILPKPPGSPEDYKLVKPETMPDGMVWNEALATELASTLHKHGAKVELAQDLLALHDKALAGMRQRLEVSPEQTMAQLKAEFGDKTESLQASAGRLASAIFKTPEELKFFEDSGMGDHPTFLKVLMRLAPLAEQDSSFVAEMARATDGGQSPEAIRQEVGRIMQDTTHPMHAGYWQRDKTVLDYIDNLYRKTYGSAPVEIH